MANYAGSLSVKPPKAGKVQLSGIMLRQAENGGHIAEHHFEGGRGYKAPEAHVFAANEGQKLVQHLSEHLGIQAGEPEEE